MRVVCIFLILIILLAQNREVSAIKNAFYLTKSNYINARTGPENFYKVKMIYKKKSLLLRVLNESDEWYQTEDIDGEKGWINKNYLAKQKKKRHVTVKDKNNDLQCYMKPNKESKIAFESGYLVNFELKRCEGDFCLLRKERTKGWCEKNKVWGL